jgi:hypothetical protein
VSAPAPARHQHAREFKATLAGQWFMLLEDASDDDTQVTIHLKSGTSATGWVTGLVGTLLVTLSETHGDYTPEWVIAFDEIAAVYCRQ